jgi:competence protein ComEA
MGRRREGFMFTRAEKGYLALTLFFLAAGSGIKAYRHAGVRLGPFPDPAASDSSTASLPADSASPPASQYDSLPGVSPLAVNDSSNGFAPAVGTAVTEGNPAPEKGDPRPRSARSSPKGAANKAAFDGKVDLNRADAAELTRIRGIGDKTAQAIVEYRRAHGPFRDFRDLLQLKGIGEKKLEKLIPYLIL